MSFLVLIVVVSRTGRLAYTQDIMKLKLYIYIHKHTLSKQT